MMLKEVATMIKVIEKLRLVIENSKLKEKWDKEKKITGMLIIEDYEIVFMIKEAEKDGQSGKRNEGYNGYLN